MKTLRLLPLIVTGLYAQWHLELFEKGSQLYDETRDKTIEIYRTTLQNFSDDEANLTFEQKHRRALRRAWSDTFDDIDKAARTVSERDTLPDSAWFQKDRQDATEELHALFETIVENLAGVGLRKEQEKLASLRQRIADNEETIAHYREAKIGAPIQSTLATTKKEYDEKIAALQNENRYLRNDIVVLKREFARYFANIGITLNERQVDVLLTRIDGNDLIRLTMVMDTLGYITRQLGRLMKESGESLKEAKRYYGMHEVLLELTLYLQRQYIDRCNNLYLAKLNDIQKRTQDTMEETLRLMREEEDPERLNAYKHNYEALKETLQTAKRYEIDLIESRDSVQHAMRITEKNLRLARNTYKTVTLSSELYDLIVQSQELFHKIGQIQLPKIIPFDNLQIKKRYNELTQKIK